MADAVHTDSHEHPEHPPHLAHHFDTPLQQFDSGKLGMWLFLATEILLFGGLFCVYAIWRANHPEIFIAGHHHLDKTLGAINTVVLILSSFTMATGVYCAQRSMQKPLIICLALTLLGGLGFMSIKFVEYRHKWHEGLLPGTSYTYDPKVLAKENLHENVGAPAEPETHAETPAASTAPAPATAAAPPPEQPAAAADEERSKIALAPAGPAGLRMEPAEDSESDDETVKNVHIFFAIYFCLTGLHGLHVLAGMAIITWLLLRAIRGDFSHEYFTPVDLGGLYWHLVDLIWIFLFPLLYLIG